MARLGPGNARCLARALDHHAVTGQRQCRLQQCRGIVVIPPLLDLSSGHYWILAKMPNRWDKMGWYLQWAFDPVVLDSVPTNVFCFVLFFPVGKQ